ncbi:hypothetical protein AAFX91_15000 [Bradyrhizobium sp. 31Argb]|uniref:hypothetical protein n=1 Tax=Bradyrhizobium sp. 31Argb TaxID=3141247 RepID=UPI00374A4277
MLLTLHDGSILVPPPDFVNPAETLTPAVRRPVGKFDPDERYARNRLCGLSPSEGNDASRDDPSIGQKCEAKITLDHRLSVLNDE